MGSWGYEIMAGDTPLDVLGDIKDLCKSVTSEDESWFDDLTKEELNQGMSKIVKDIPDDYWFEPFIQVLAYQIIMTGADMPQIVKDSIDEATNEDVSHWSEPKERKQRLEELRLATHMYENGKPINLAQDPGLFAKIYEGLK